METALRAGEPEDRERAMDRFIIHENIKRYRQLLERAAGEKERAQLYILLVEELRKQKALDGEMRGAHR